MQPPRKWVPCHSRSGPFLTGCGSHGIVRASTLGLSMCALTCRSFKLVKWQCLFLDCVTWLSKSPGIWQTWHRQFGYVTEWNPSPSRSTFLFLRQPENLGPWSLSVFNKNSTLRTSKVGGGVFCCMARRAELRLGLLHTRCTWDQNWSSRWHSLAIWFLPANKLIHIYFSILRSSKSSPWKTELQKLDVPYSKYGLFWVSFSHIGWLRSVGSIKL